LEKKEGKWLLSKYVDSIILQNPRFLISEKGRQRVIREKRKNVHCYIAGEEYFGYLNNRSFKFISYNPYKAGHFVDEEGKKIEAGSFIELTVENKRAIVKWYE
jgi:hypothetical protein